MLRELYSYHFHGLKPGLDRISELMKDMGNPHMSYDYVHITGTNGKGSTSHYCADILRSEGKRVGLYTSPHLNDFRERIQINGEMADKERTASILEGLLKNARERRYSFFEITTALAFEYFKEKHIDIAVLEVGMGGRWDATNIVDSKRAIITNVSLEHTQYLGSTIEAIAFEKSGIIKENANVVTCADDGALDVIRRIAGERNSKLSVLNRDFRYVSKSSTIEGNSFTYADESSEIELENRLAGLRQMENACSAVRAVKDMVSESALKKGIKNAFIPGRFEVVKRDGKRVIIDGAHNPGAAASLANDLSFFCIKPVLVLGVLKDKNYSEICKALCPLAHLVIVTEPRADRKLEREALAEEARKYSSVIVAKDLGSAIDLGLNMGSDVCVAGSLYLAGEAREVLGLTESREHFRGDF
jgi:dihydrofolate synthase/folylpolyglutamate synthase